MNNFETNQNKNRQETFSNEQENIEFKKTSKEEFLNKLKNSITQTSEIRNKVKEDTAHLNKLRETLGLTQTEDTPSITATKRYLSNLEKEQNILRTEVIGSKDYSVNDLEGIVGENQKHMGYEIATKNNLLYEKDSSDRQRSYTENKVALNNKIRDTADRINKGGMQMSDEEWNTKKQEEAQEEQNYTTEFNKKLSDFDEKIKRQEEEEKKAIEDSRKKLEEIDPNERHDTFFGRDDNVRAKEKSDKEYWDNYENTVTGMNELLGYKPVDAQKYKLQLEKEMTEQGKTKEEIEERWGNVLQNGKTFYNL